MRYRYNTTEWIREYFPEYLVDGQPIQLTTGVWPILGHPSTKETKPWKYAPSETDGVTVNMQGQRVSVSAVSGPPYYRYTTTPASEEDFRAACDAVNYFRNGQRGINPLLLHGGKRAFSSEPYRCATGLYYPAKGGEPARFEFYDGTVVTA